MPVSNPVFRQLVLKLLRHNGIYFSKNGMEKFDLDSLSSGGCNWWKYFLHLFWKKILLFAFFFQKAPLFGFIFRRKASTGSFICTSLKPSLSMKILSINDFINKLHSNFLRNLSNRVHLKVISKFINKVINRQYFCKWTCFKCPFTITVSVNNFINKITNTL